MTTPLLVCRCGEARSPEEAREFDVGAWIVDHHTGDGHRVATDRYRADCSPPRGCRRCGEPARGRFLFYCSPECNRIFQADHWWPAARFTALGYEHAGGNYWTPRPTVCAQADDTCSVGDFEVNHIAPLNGDRPTWGCVNHQDNLEPLCHSHHVRETKAQRRDGRIGTPESAARLRAHDAEHVALERRRALRELQNPRLM